MKKKYLLVVDIALFVMVIASFFKGLAIGLGALVLYILFVHFALKEFMDANRDRFQADDK